MKILQDALTSSLSGNFTALVNHKGISFAEGKEGNGGMGLSLAFDLAKLLNANLLLANDGWLAVREGESPTVSFVIDFSGGENRPANEENKPLIKFENPPPSYINMNIRHYKIVPTTHQNILMSWPSKIFSSVDRALISKENLGGIDFNPDKMNLNVHNSTGEIKFKLDPAMIAQLQKAPGFVPVIFNIQPMTDLKIFLGLADNQSPADL
ncbi:MAG: hypothetical protein HQL12_00005 [Candidatus Omnitrophica bacterium]|nr:hypothetical protein [Candidatus Omnitrophota bacterium]